MNSELLIKKSIIPQMSTQILPQEQEMWIRNEIIITNKFLVNIGKNEIVDDKQRMELRYKSILKMDSFYNKEIISYSTHLDRIDNYQIFTYNGKLYDSKGNPINTESLEFSTGAILVMTEEGSLFLS